MRGEGVKGERGRWLWCEGRERKVVRVRRERGRQ